MTRAEAVMFRQRPTDSRKLIPLVVTTATAGTLLLSQGAPARPQWRTTGSVVEDQRLRSIKPAVTSDGMLISNRVYHRHFDDAYDFLALSLSTFQLGSTSSRLDTLADEKSASNPALASLRWIEETTGLSQERIGRLLGVTRQSLHLWHQGQSIAFENQQRLAAVHDVLRRAWEWHSSREQLTAWLVTPRGGEGVTPQQLLERNEIDRARLYALTSQSPRLLNPLGAQQRTIPASWRSGAERRQQPAPLEFEDNEMLVDLLAEDDDSEAAVARLDED